MNETTTADGGREASNDGPESTVEAGGEEHVEEGVLDKVPVSVVSLGAGFLLASTLVSAVGAIYGWYSIATGQFYGFPPYALVLLSLEFTFVTIVHAAATRWARQRTRWLWVMLAAILGLFLIVTIPLNLPAIVCLGLGKRHFSSHTPAEEVRRALRGGEEPESDEDENENEDEKEGA